MSFGYSVSDAVALAQLVTRVYNGWKSACGDYANVTSDLAVLQTLLNNVEREARAPDSVFARNPDDLHGWEMLSRGCYTVVTELKSIVDKFKSLGTSRRRNWDRIRMGNRNLDSLNRELVKKTASISAYLSVLGISSQMRMENEAFPNLLGKIDDLAAQIRKGNGTIKSSITWSTYDGDDKAIWREFRRDLVHSGFRSRDIYKYRVALKAYICRLQREGMLDEETPNLRTLSTVHNRQASSSSESMEMPQETLNGHSLAAIEDEDLSDAIQRARTASLPLLPSPLLSPDMEPTPLPPPPPPPPPLSCDAEFSPPPLSSDIEPTPLPPMLSSSSPRKSVAFDPSVREPINIRISVEGSEGCIDSELLDRKHAYKVAKWRAGRASMIEIDRIMREKRARRLGTAGRWFLGL